MTHEALKELISPDVYNRLKVLLDQNDKPLVIAGSGPSLRRINYKKLPKEFLTFRINNFFLEDKYYLGRKVDACYASMPRPETLYTLANTATNYDYEFTTDCIFTRERVSKRFPPKEYFPRVEVEKILSIDTKMSSYMAEIFYYQNKHITSGILALLAAIAMGFKEIYLIGLDFYSDENQRYAYKIGENYKKTVEEQDLLPGYSENFHSREIDLKGLDIALSYPDVKIFSICDDAFINQFVELAPENKIASYNPETKSKNSISDYEILPKEQKQSNTTGFQSVVLRSGIAEMKKTLLIRFIWGIFIKPLIIIPVKTLYRAIRFLKK